MKWFAVVFLLIGLTSLRADENAANPQPALAAGPVTDPTQVAAHYREVLTLPQYQDMNEPSVDSRVEDWLSQWFKRLGTQLGDFQYANRMPAFESLLMTVLVVFSISILFYIMVRLTHRRARMDDESFEELSTQQAFRPPEFYDEEIQHAIQAEDWHGAWLAAWRQFLSRLEHGHLVDADRSRTNREYLIQLRGKSLPASALALLNGMVDGYDRFIYGRKAIGQSDWNAFHQQIDEAALLLHLDEKITRETAPRSST